MPTPIDRFVGRAVPLGEIVLYGATCGAQRRVPHVKRLRMALLRAYAALLHVVRPNAGMTVLSFNRVTNALFAGVDGPLVARMPCGARIEVDPADYNGRKLWLLGSNDWKVSRTVNALLREGDVLLDIGANFGSIGFDAIERVGPSGAVHFFEPQATLAARIEAAAKEAGLAQVGVHRAALSDADGEVTLSWPAHHSGMATILTAGNAARARYRNEKVPMYDTAAYVAPLVAGRRFGVKIDVEGAEPNVLPGLLQQDGLTFVVFEGKSSKRWLWDFFSRHGFAVFGMARTPLRPRIAPVARFEDWSPYYEFVAVPAQEGLPTREVALRAFAAAARP